MQTEPKPIDLKPAIYLVATKTLFDPLSEIGVGFGFAGLTKDGATVWQENTKVDRSLDDVLTGSDAERIAAGDPQHDWRIVIDGPFAKYVYQRHGVAKWVLIEKGEGFA